ncbi:MAG: hypothetical protein ACOYD9_09290, partial [Pyramidobacter sp.]
MKKRRFFLRCNAAYAAVGLVLCLFAAACAFPAAAEGRSGKKAPVSCEAPQWLEKAMAGSMNAVWRELQAGRMSHRSALEALALVAGRLFSGYDVALSPRGEVVLRPSRRWSWTAELHMPETVALLPSPYPDLLKKDMAAALPALEEFVAGVPPEALQWAEENFQYALNDLLARDVPGWRCSARVEVEGTDARLDVKLHPQPPLVLAVVPETLSDTIPQLLADKISDRTVELLSPLTGFPMSWVAHHRQEILSWLGEKQLENGWLKTLQSSAENTIDLKPLSRVKTRIESTTATLRGWVSAHAGGEARLEAGVHLGRYFNIGSVPSEAYVEALFKLEHWHADGRLGLRFSPVRQMWLGVEASTEERSDLWYRLWL